MYQLIVVGGPAGIAAAIAARRQGMKTLLVERYGSSEEWLQQVWLLPLCHPGSRRLVSGTIGKA